jgi:hypothetical protein
LIAAYASILEKHPGAAAVLAAVGAWLTLWFNRLDARSCQLVEAGEDALKVSQARLAGLADNPHLKKFSMLWTSPALALLLIAW